MNRFPSTCSRASLQLSKWLALLCALIAVVFAVSCGGSSPPGVTPPPSGTPDAGKGGVRGYLFARGAAPDLVFGSSPTPPTGFTAVSGASALVTDSGAPVRTDSTGLFNIPGVPAGLHTIRITPPSGAAHDYPITVIGGATVDLGVPPVSRDQAAVSVQQAISAIVPIDTVLIMSPREPLPPGVAVSPALGDSDGQPAPALDTHVSRPSWFFFVDAQVGQRFQHPVTFYFVDAVTGALSTTEESSWPRLNGLDYYADLDNNMVSTDLVHAPTGIAAARSVASRQVKPPWPHTPSRDQVDGCAGGKVYALLVQGDARNDFAADFAAVPAMLGASGLGVVGDVKTYSPPAVGTVDAGARVRSAFTSLCAETSPCDTLFIYVTTHGTPSGKLILVGGQAPNGSATSLSYVRPETLFDFTKCRACNIIVIIDACYSEVAALHLAQAVRPLTGTKVTIMAAALSTQTAGGITLANAQRDHTYPGGVFTANFLVAFQAVAHSQGHVGIDDLGGIYDTTEVGMPDYQHAVILRRQLQPGESCGKLATVTSGPISATHRQDSNRCPDPIGTIALNNVSAGSLDYKATSTNAVFQVLNGAGTMVVGSSITLNVQYDCSQPPLQTGAISILVSNAGGANQTLSVPVTVDGGNYIVTDLGKIVPHGINALGQIAGGGYANETIGAKLWSPTIPNGTVGSVVTLHDVTNLNIGAGLAINDLGGVVGNYEPASDRFHLHGFVWTPSAANGSQGVLTDLGDFGLAGTSDSSIQSINKAGVMVGSRHDDSSIFDSTRQGLHAFRHSGTAPLSDADDMDLGDHVLSDATGINNPGQVVGSGGRLDGGLQDPHRANGGFRTPAGTQLITPADGLGYMISGNPEVGTVSPSAINDAGQVIGVYTGRPTGGLLVWHAFRTGPNASFNIATDDLGALPGWRTSQALGINARGDVVGSCAKDSAYVAFLYKDSKMYDLNTLIAANGTQFLTQAFGINDRGQIIAFGTNHGYLLTPR